ncbi:hypothetical protein [Periweissella fabalis]|uniref:DUF1056 family protein n=1 Tax=Periweissella fabalis TaxID=1070421 RepID=A0A7X6N378_9LACO|nr:hypothetical protein [Periweissella fabalis]MCM0598314.1 hypothetical protein [Periweissella fabalis]NKZ24946.1 hypothetical protein [Periweissella fabalis]
MNKLDILNKQILSILPMILFLAGLVALVVAGWLFNTIIGLIVLGICLIFVGYIVSPQGGVK